MTSRVIDGLYMVVMEYRSNASPLLRFFLPSALQYPLVKADVIRENLTKAPGLLHGQGLVLGDLQAPNILYSHECHRVFLVGSDWVGKDRENRYSPCLDKLWLDIVRWQIMEKAHDIRASTMLWNGSRKYPESNPEVCSVIASS